MELFNRLRIKKEMLFISLFWYFYCCPLVNDRY